LRILNCFSSSDGSIVVFPLMNLSTMNKLSVHLSQATFDTSIDLTSPSIEFDFSRAWISLLFSSISYLTFLISFSFSIRSSWSPLLAEFAFWIIAFEFKISCFASSIRSSWFLIITYLSFPALDGKDQKNYPMPILSC